MGEHLPKDLRSFSVQLHEPLRYTGTIILFISWFLKPQWCKSGPYLTPKWSKSVPNLRPKWSKFMPYFGPKWSKSVCSLRPKRCKWSKSEPFLKSKCSKSVPCLNPKWSKSKMVKWKQIYCGSQRSNSWKGKGKDRKWYVMNYFPVYSHCTDLKITFLVNLIC